MILNIADLSRYAKSQRDQAIGQSLGYGPPFLLMIFCGILIAGSAFSSTCNHAVWLTRMYYRPSSIHSVPGT